MADIKIFDSHHPALDAGTYKINIIQTLQAGGNTLDVNSPELTFMVEGEKYALDQQQIDSVFPPAASMGDFSLVLPHLILNRSTLPWERESQDGKTDKPWLALLLFTEDEMSLTDDITVGKSFCVRHILKNTWDKTLSPENKDLISIIVYNDEKSLENMLPAHIELPYLAHVRANGDDQKAVLVCNRLPKIDRKNIVHLVSLEDRFDAAGEFISAVNGNMGLVSLKSWEFFCNDHFIITPEVLDRYKASDEKIAGSETLFVSEDLSDALSEIIGKEYFDEAKLVADLVDPYKSVYLKDKTSLTDEENVNLSKIEYLLKTFRIGHFPDILKHLNRTPGTLRHNDDNIYSKQGYCNVPYILKSGKGIEAFYKGPLVPGIPASDAAPIMLKHADEALRYISDANKLDASYAAAWEIGKLLAIQNKNFSIDLYKWKRACYQAIKQNNNQPLEAYPQPSTLISEWFYNVKDLKGIPFNYLVPDPSYIPFESIRFFKVDDTWIKYMIDGAWSIGRISGAEAGYDTMLYNNFDFLKTSPAIRSGFLLHSVAVAGWPDLVIYNSEIKNTKFDGPSGYIKCANEGDSYEFTNLVDVAYGAKGSFNYKKGVSGNVSFNSATFDDPIPGTNKFGYYKFRKDKLSPNLLFCLFNKAIDSICIHQKPESIHFGFEDLNEDDQLFNGSASFSYKPEKSPDEAKRINIATQNIEVAEFVNKLVQDIEVITFNFSF